MSDFETQARKLRYQALGDACRRQGIALLATAHHSDDVAESVLMGIAAGESGQLARAIKSRVQIPECWGMHGVHTSGAHDLPTKKWLDFEEKWSKELSKPHDPRVFEKGGVQVLRPLLSFDKERLISTCRHAEVEWEEDETNVQVWRTPRNAVRAMLLGCKLPYALRKNSLLKLWNRRRLASIANNALFHAAEYSCDVVSFDVRSGVLKIRMATSIIPSILPERVEKAFSSQRFAANVLECFVSAVSPQEATRLESLQYAVMTVFPDLMPQHLNSLNQPASFTARGVSFSRIYCPIENHPRTTQASMTAQTTGLDPTFVWVFHRQPFGAQLPQQIIPPIYSNQPNEPLSISRIAGRRFGPPQHVEWGPWRLWDGRYWIRVKNGSSRPVVIRPLLPTDIARLKDTISESKLQIFKGYLKEVAPGKIRWTLPAIVQPAANEHVTDKLIALPSFQRKAQTDIVPRCEDSNIDYEIRYKSVSLKPCSFRRAKAASSSIKRDPYSNIRWHRNKVRSWQD